MRRGDLYRVRHPSGDPKRSRVFVVVSRPALIRARFATVICAPVLTHGEGLTTQVAVGPPPPHPPVSLLDAPPPARYPTGHRPLCRPPPTPSEALIRRWDDQALTMVSGIEKCIIPLDLDSQGQFIALTNAIQMQLESGAPVADVVRLLGDALLALAQARALPQETRTDLARRFSALHTRLSTTTGTAPKR